MNSFLATQDILTRTVESLNLDYKTIRRLRTNNINILKDFLGKKYKDFLFMGFNRLEIENIEIEIYKYFPQNLQNEASVDRPTVKLSKLGALKRVKEKLTIDKKGYSECITITWTTNGEIFIDPDSWHGKIRLEKGLLDEDIILEGNASFVAGVGCIGNEIFVCRFKSTNAENYAELCATATQETKKFLRGKGIKIKW